MKVPSDHPDLHVCVIGLGYVGLTLAVALAEAGFTVRGVERDPHIVEVVNGGRAHFSEAGLDPRLALQVRNGRLRASESMPHAGECSVFVITVGTPLAPGARRTNLDAIRLVSGRVRDVLRPDDMVILRSTVRIGVSQQVVRPVLDEAGVPYDLAFCPERTLEGKALEELRTLPQIVGGLTEKATVRASQFFNFVTPTTIRVRDLETAEMIKLINNTHRDLMFAFANEVAGMCDAVGVSAVEVIRAGKMGYPRASMSLPLPGPVGGPCLEKDPYILAEGVEAKGGSARLTLMGRQINERLPREVAELVRDLLGDRAAPPRIAVLGLSFKGRPETSDLRGSLAIPLLLELGSKFPGAPLLGHDPMVEGGDVQAIGAVPVATAQEAFAEADCVIFQNDNPSFAKLDLSDLSRTMAPGAVIYDLWNQFDVETLSLARGVRYFGLGSRVLLGGSGSASPHGVADQTAAERAGPVTADS